MNAKLLIDGKEFDIEILDPKLQELLVPSKKKTGYEKVIHPSQETPLYYDYSGEVQWGDYHDQDDYDAANYYSDKSVAENNARADKLMRQLRRFAVEHRKGNIDVLNDGWYEICYDDTTNSINIESVTDYKYFGTIIFDTYDNTKLAINTFRDELFWYFTEYKDSL